MIWRSRWSRKSGPLLNRCKNKGVNNLWAGLSLRKTATLSLKSKNFCNHLRDLKIISRNSKFLLIFSHLLKRRTTNKFSTLALASRWAPMRKWKPCSMSVTSQMLPWAVNRIFHPPLLWVRDQGATLALSLTRSWILVFHQLWCNWRLRPSSLLPSNRLLTS
jgi:hypothetical protein